MIQNLPSASRQYVSNHLTTDNWNSVWKRFDRLSKAGVFEAFFGTLASMSSTAHLIRVRTPPSCARMCRRPGQKGARRPGARTFARRLHHENPRKIGRLRRHHRLRSDRRRSFRRASLRNPARHRTRHPASRRHLRQRLRQQGQPRGGKGARHRAGHPAQGQRKRQAGLLRAHPLQGPRPHRAGRRTPQAVQARRAPLQKARTKLPINRQLRRRPLLDQIRPHRLVFHQPQTPHGLADMPPHAFASALDVLSCNRFINRRLHALPC